MDIQYQSVVDVALHMGSVTHKDSAESSVMGSDVTSPHRRLPG